MSRLLVLAALLAACTTALVVARAGSAATVAEPVAAGRDAASRSAALAAAPAVDRFAVDTPVPAALARAVAAEVARDVPRPIGGTFDGIRWETAGGTFARAEIAGLLQYNAACQWLRARRDGREPAVSERVLADLPTWPALRGRETAARLAGAVADLGAGGGPVAAGALAECDASHAREVAYAESLGLTPTR